MEVRTSTRPGSGTQPPGVPIASPARERLKAALAATVVTDPRGEKLLQAVRIAQDRETSARRELDAVDGIDRRNLEAWLNGDMSGPKPEGNHVARREAQAELENAQRELAVAQRSQADHQAAMQPAREAAARASSQVPQLVLGVLQQEGEALIEELRRRLAVANGVLIRIEGLRLRGIQLGDYAGRQDGYRLAERLRDLLGDALRGLHLAAKPVSPFDTPVRDAIQAWADCERAVALDPAANIDAIIESTAKRS